jgi:hypothetical protein
MATAYAMHRKVSCSCHGIADEFHKEYILLWDSGDFLDKATELHKIVSSAPCYRSESDPWLLKWRTLMRKIVCL